MSGLAQRNTRGKENYLKTIVINQGLEIRTQSRETVVGMGRRGEESNFEE